MSKEEAVETLASKTRLDIYLEGGLRIADRVGLDLTREVGARHEVR